VTSTEAGPGSALTLRPAQPGDAAVVAEVYLASRRAAAPAMPPPVHDDASIRAWVRGRLAEDEVWVAEVDGQVVGYARMSDEWLDDLYVDPRWSGRGIGSALLDLTKALRPGGFGLWVFASNVSARRFYRRHGLVEVEETDGSGNEEGAPDVRMSWRA
jgi:GNAT superfamily N-acetyltransferase